MLRADMSEIIKTSDWRRARGVGFNEVTVLRRCPSFDCQLISNHFSQTISRVQFVYIVLAASHQPFVSGTGMVDIITSLRHPKGMAA